MDSEDEIFFTVERKNIAGSLGNSFDGAATRDKLSGATGGCRRANLQQQLSEPESSRSTRSSIVDGLLCEIYDRFHVPPWRGYSIDSDTFTEYSSTSDVAFLGGRSGERQTQRLSADFLTTKGKELDPHAG